MNAIIKFEKKIIHAGDQVVPDYKTLTISNPNYEESLKWSLDKSKLLNQRIFSINP